MAADLSSLLRTLYRGPKSSAPDVVNPYRDEVSELDRPGAARCRRANLEAYLEEVGRHEYAPDSTVLEVIS